MGDTNVLCYLSLGSNIEPRAEYLDRAITALEGLGKIVSLSAIHETDPIGPPQAKFLNQVAALTTNLLPDELLLACKNIERGLGRQNHAHWSPREIDIDIILYNQQIVDMVSLHIPHLELTQRRFVLEPLAEIAPQVINPRTNKTIEQHLYELSISQ